MGWCGSCGLGRGGGRGVSLLRGLGGRCGDGVVSGARWGIFRGWFVVGVVYSISSRSVGMLLLLLLLRRGRGRGGRRGAKAEAVGEERGGLEYVGMFCLRKFCVEHGCDAAWLHDEGRKRKQGRAK